MNPCIWCNNLDETGFIIDEKGRECWGCHKGRTPLSMWMDGDDILIEDGIVYRRKERLRWKEIQRLTSVEKSEKDKVNNKKKIGFEKIKNEKKNNIFKNLKKGGEGPTSPTQGSLKSKSKSNVKKERRRRRKGEGGTPPSKAVIEVDVRPSVEEQAKDITIGSIGGTASKNVDIKVNINGIDKGVDTGPPVDEIIEIVEEKRGVEAPLLNRESRNVESGGREELPPSIESENGGGRVIGLPLEVNIPGEDWGGGETPEAIVEEENLDEVEEKIFGEEKKIIFDENVGKEKNFDEEKKIIFFEEDEDKKINYDEEIRIFGEEKKKNFNEDEEIKIYSEEKEEKENFDEEKKILSEEKEKEKDLEKKEENLSEEKEFKEEKEKEQCEDEDEEKLKKLLLEIEKLKRKIKEKNDRVEREAPLEIEEQEQGVELEAPPKVEERVEQNAPLPVEEVGSPRVESNTPLVEIPRVEWETPLGEELWSKNKKKLDVEWILEEYWKFIEKEWKIEDKVKVKDNNYHYYDNMNSDNFEWWRERLKKECLIELLIVMLIKLICVMEMLKDWNKMECFEWWRVKSKLNYY